MSPWFKLEPSRAISVSALEKAGARKAPATRSRNRKNRESAPEAPATREEGGGTSFSKVLGNVLSLTQFWLLASLLICAGYQSYYIFFKALYFRIQEIHVTGNRALEPRDVIRLSGVDLGDLFFKYNYEKVKERIRENRRVEDVRVVVKSPNTVEIQVREKEPRFYLGKGSRELEIDHEGYVLGSKVGDLGLPQIQGVDPDPRPAPAVTELSVDQRALLVRWLPILEKSPLKEFESLDLGSSQIAVQLKGIRYLLFDPGIFRLTAGLLPEIFEKARSLSRQVSTVDLRFVSPVVTLKPLPPPATSAGASAPTTGVSTGPVAVTVLAPVTAVLPSLAPPQSPLAPRPSPSPPPSSAPAPTAPSPEASAAVVEPAEPEEDLEDTDSDQEIRRVIEEETRSQEKERELERGQEQEQEQERDRPKAQEPAVEPAGTPAAEPPARARGDDE